MKSLFERRKLWEILSVIFATFFVVFNVGYSIAMSKRSVINKELGIDETSIERSTDAQYQYYPRTYNSEEELEAYYRATCEEIEAEGLVLMQNENSALPLSSGDKVSLFLSGAVRFNYGSSGSSAANTSSYTDFKTALTAQGLSVNETLWEHYKSQTGRRNYKINEEYDFEDLDDEGLLDELSSYSTAILVFARDSGEGMDIPVTGSDGKDKSYLTISAQEESILQGLTEKKKEGTVKKIIAILNSSAPLQLDFLYEEGIEVDAVVWVGNVGVSGIDAVAKALTGEVVPSGKLSDTYLRNNFSSPAMAQQKLNTATYSSFASIYGKADEYGLNETQKFYGVYNEGIYVGYRYYETRYTDYVNGAAGVGDYDYSKDVAFPFGYGISYTTFSYGDFSVAKSDKTYTVSVKVTNTGSTYSGKESVQVYLQKPYTDYDVENGVEKAAVELVGYAKTGVLAPGASQTLTITVSESLFKSYDANGAKTYIVDAGKYYLTVANGAHEAANNILAYQGKTPANTDGRMDAEGNKAFVYETELAFDKETYSVSPYTGEKITNQFEFADLNKYENTDTKVTYVSRSNWTGTFPKEAIVITLNDAMAADLGSNKDIIEDEGATKPNYGKSSELNLLSLRGLAYDDPKWDELLDMLTYEEQAYLVSNGYFLTAPVYSVVKPDTKESDGPTGLSASPASLSFPSEGIWASSMNDELIEKVGDCLAEDALAIGVTGIYAGGVNIHRTPFIGRSHEYFSEDPYLTASAAVAETIGLQKKGVIAHIKHLAFNEQETQRNGIGIWLNEQEAREIMLYPFEAVLSKNENESGAHAVMSSFNRAGTIWTGASSNLLINVLAGEWGFTGYNITDMASSNGQYYMTFKDGVMNGTNVYLGNGSENALDEFKDSATFAQRMRESTHRVLYAVANYSSAMNGITPDTSIGSGMYWWKVMLVSLEIAFGVLAGCSILMYSISLFKTRKKKQ